MTQRLDTGKVFLYNAQRETWQKTTKDYSQQGRSSTDCIIQRKKRAGGGISKRVLPRVFSFGHLLTVKNDRSMDGSHIAGSSGIHTLESGRNNYKKLT